MLKKPVREGGREEGAGKAEAEQHSLGEQLQVAEQKGRGQLVAAKCPEIQAKGKRFLNEKEGLLLKQKQKTQTSPIW